MGAERRHSSQGPRWNVTGPPWHFRVVGCVNLTSAHHVSARIAGGSNDISVLTIPHFFSLLERHESAHSNTGVSKFKRYGVASIYNNHNNGSHLFITALRAYAPISFNPDINGTG